LNNDDNNSNDNNNLDCSGSQLSIC